MAKKLDKNSTIFVLAHYLIISYIRVLIVSLGVTAVLFVVLMLLGLYPQIASVLDLKYDSPFVLVPLYAFSVLTLLCLVVSFLLFFHKYRRSKAISKFGESFSIIIESNKTDK